MSQINFVLVSLLGSAAVATFVKINAVRLKVVDVPNYRSLHHLPKPRGGGLGIAIFGLSGLLIGGTSQWEWYLLGSSLLVALIGWVDDSGGVRARTRFVVHSLAAGIFIYGLAGIFSLNLGVVELRGDWLMIPAFLMLVWMLNLYNFMDGIDGLAGVEALIGAGFLSAVSYYLESPDLGAIYLTLACASLGFLVLNWPPAKIFMGDVGSGFLGFVFAALAIRADLSQQLPLSATLIIFGYFIVDSGVTLVRRTLLGEPVYIAHRKHAYQKAVQKGHSHRKVTIGIALLNLIWLAPLAAMSVLNPKWQLVYILVAYLPLVWLCLKFEAGKN